MRASPTSRRFQKVKLSLQPCWLLFVLSAFSRTSKLSRMARPFHAFLAALLRQSAQEAVPGDLLGDDECLESSTCALNALQMRGKAMEAVEERQMPWMMMPPPSRWGMPAYHPSPVMPPWRRPEPMGPMPYYSPESYMHPQPASYMHPQPVEPADMPQPEEEHPKMVTRRGPGRLGEAKLRLLKPMETRSHNRPQLNRPPGPWAQGPKVTADKPMVENGHPQPFCTKNLPVCRNFRLRVTSTKSP